MQSLHYQDMEMRTIWLASACNLSDMPLQSYLKGVVCPWPLSIYPFYLLDIATSWVIAIVRAPVKQVSVACRKDRLEARQFTHTRTVGDAACLVCVCRVGLNCTCSY